jgi:hypothetical protein
MGEDPVVRTPGEAVTGPAAGAAAAAAAAGKPGPAGGAWWRRLGNLGGSTVGMLALLLLAVAVCDRTKVMFDLSADHRFTVGEELRRIVAQQQADAVLVGVWRPEAPIDSATISTALGQICALNPHITWKHIDPDLDAPEWGRFQETYHQATDPALYVTRAGRAFRIPLTAGTRNYLQRDVGGALVTLGSADPTPAVVMQGHGELRPGGGADDGCDQLLSALSLSGFQVVIDDPAHPATISPAAVVVIAGPTRPYGPETLARLDAHLQDGGGMLVCADDRCPRDLARLLQRHGVLISASFPEAMRDGNFAALADLNAPVMPGMVVHSMQFNAAQGSDFPYANLVLGNGMMDPAPEAPTSAVAAAGVTVLSPRTAVVEALTAEVLTHGADPAAAAAALVPPAMFVPAKVRPILFSAPGDVWLQGFNAPLARPKGLEQAPLQHLAMMVDWPADARSVREGVGAEAIVWGSRQAASDGVVGQVRFANGDLLMAMVRGLTRGSGAEAAQQIPKAEVRQYQVSVSENVLYALFCFLVLVLPMVSIGAAMLMWWDRR